MRLALTEGTNWLLVRFEAQAVIPWRCRWRHFGYQSGTKFIAAI